MDKENKTVWTIGHSTHPFDQFISILQSFNIGHIADVRTYPGSRKYPQFNKESLEITLPAANIQYTHLPQLGGRRKAKSESKNTGWKNAAFRGYADYMDTEDFKNGIVTLEKLATHHRVAYMCSESVWWRCHRRLVSDYLTMRGWTVTHIMGENKGSEHVLTSPAVIVNGQLSYEEQQTLF
jgi:uncharacterized protein (DUF488 family)